VKGYVYHVSIIIWPQVLVEMKMISLVCAQESEPLYFNINAEQF